MLEQFDCLPPNLGGAALRSCTSLASFAASWDVRVVWADVSSTSVCQSTDVAVARLVKVLALSCSKDSMAALAP
jgi:hypothetical protein